SVSASPAGGNTLNLNDCESRVIADDPGGNVSGSCCPGVVATAFYGCNSSCGSCADTMKNGETYASVDQADVVINHGVSMAAFSAGNFLSTMVHELGHTWGFRHSDKNRTDNGACSAPLECTSSAIMNSVIVNGLNGSLQTWDRHAANEVYGDGSQQSSFA